MLTMAVIIAAVFAEGSLGGLGGRLAGVMRAGRLTVLSHVGYLSQALLSLGPPGGEEARCGKVRAGIKGMSRSSWLEMLSMPSASPPVLCL